LASKHQLKGKLLKLKNFVIDYKQLLTKTINRTRSFWPEIFILELGLNQLINISDQRVNKQSTTMDGT
jgi:hypothetical protein